LWEELLFLSIKCNIDINDGFKLPKVLREFLIKKYTEWKNEEEKEIKKDTDKVKKMSKKIKRK